MSSDNITFEECISMTGSFKNVPFLIIVIKSSNLLIYSI